MKLKRNLIILLIPLLYTTMYSQDLGEKVYKDVSRKGELFSKWLIYGAIYEYNSEGKEIHSISIKPNYYEKWREYDSKGNEIYSKTYIGGLGTIEEWYEYDSKGNRINLISSINQNEWYEYNSDGKMIHKKKSDGTNEWYDYNDKGQKIHAKLSSTEDESYEYDLEGNLSCTKEYYNNELSQETKNTYDSNGKLIYSVISTSYSSNTYESWYEYDNKGNMIYIKSPFGEYWYEYDDKGNMIYSKSNNILENWYEYDYYPNGHKKTMKVYQKLEN